MNVDAGVMFRGPLMFVIPKGGRRFLAVRRICLDAGLVLDEDINVFVGLRTAEMTVRAGAKEFGLAVRFPKRAGGKS